MHYERLIRGSDSTHEQALILLRVRTEQFICGFVLSTVRLSNIIPVEIFNSINLRNFKEAVNSHLFCLSSSIVFPKYTGMGIQTAAAVFFEKVMGIMVSFERPSLTHARQPVCLSICPSIRPTVCLIT